MNTHTLAANVFWVADNAALRDAVASFDCVIGLDTEFQRTDTFYPIPGLYQVSSAGQTWLIDPLSIDDFEPLAQALERPDGVVVMHACTEDLELILHHLGVNPRNVFDTQYAFAFLSDRFSLSYTALVDELLGADSAASLGGSQTRSNWLRRPLKPAQLLYAAADVRYLIPLYELLRGRLEQADRWPWYQEDMRRRGLHLVEDPQNYYRLVRKAWTLKTDGLLRLRSLCAWREHTAMQQDVPRKRIVWDEHLLEFARINPLTMRDLEALLPRSVAARFGPEMLAAHNGAEKPGSTDISVPRPLTQGQAKVTKTLRDSAKVKAEQLQLSTELLARKRDIEAMYRQFLRTGELAQFYAGWRRTVIGEALLAQCVAAQRQS